MSFHLKGAKKCGSHVGSPRSHESFLISDFRTREDQTGRKTKSSSCQHKTSSVMSTASWKCPPARLPSALDWKHMEAAHSDQEFITGRIIRESLPLPHHCPTSALQGELLSGKSQGLGIWIMSGKKGRMEVEEHISRSLFTPSMMIPNNPKPTVPS